MQRIAKEWQRNAKSLQRKLFLTSGVKAHLGGLSEQLHLTIILPLHSPLDVRWVWGKKKGENIGCLVKRENIENYFIFIIILFHIQESIFWVMP